MRGVSAAKTAAAGDAAAAVVDRAAGLLGAPDRLALGDLGRWSTGAASRAAPRPAARRGRRRRRPTPARRRRGTCPSCMRVVVDLDDRACRRRCRCGWRTTRRARRIRSASFMNQLRDRRAAAAEHAAGERVVVGDQALGLERGDHRRVPAARRARGPRRHAHAGAVADDDHRPLQRPEQRDGRPRATAAGGEMRVEATRPAGGPASRSPAGRVCTSSGRIRCTTPRRSDRVLGGERGELGVIGRREHGLAPGGDRRERGGEVDLLEVARRRAPGRRPGRDSAITGARSTLRVVQPGQQVRRARDRRSPGRQPGGRSASPYADAANAAAPSWRMPTYSSRAGLHLAADRVGQAEVRVADHPEHVVDAPGDERLGHHVGDGALVLGLGRRRRRRCRRRAPRPGSDATASPKPPAAAGQRAVVVAVPRAAQQPVLDRPLAERPALVRAAVVERAVLPVVVRERERPVAGDDGASPAPPAARRGRAPGASPAANR